MFDTDEHVRADASLEGMAKLKAVFQKENGTVTAGNASGINDAAAAVVLMEKSAAAAKGLEADGAAGVLRPRRARSQDHGPRARYRPSSARWRRPGSRSSDIDVIESNEAFAAQAMGVTKELGLDPAKVNPNGGAVALGHPIGATGASSRSRRCTSCSAPAAATASSRCASAAARASRRSSSGCSARGSGARSDGCPRGPTVQATTTTLNPPQNIRLPSKGMRLRIHHGGKARILHHLGVDAIAVRARLVHDPRKHHRLAGLELDALRKRRVLSRPSRRRQRTPGNRGRHTPARFFRPSSPCANRREGFSLVPAIRNRQRSS